MQPFRITLNDEALNNAFHFKLPPSLENKGPISLEIKNLDPIVKENFKKLLTRNRGEIYTVDEGDNLVAVEGWFQKWKVKRSVENQARVRHILQNIFGALNTHLQNLNDEKSVKVHRHVMRDLFSSTGKLGRLRKALIPGIDPASHLAAFLLREGEIRISVPRKEEPESYTTLFFPHQKNLRPELPFSLDLGDNDANQNLFGALLQSRPKQVVWIENGQEKTVRSFSKEQINALRFDANEMSKTRMSQLLGKLDEFLQTLYNNPEKETERKIYRLIAANLLGSQGAIGRFAGRWPELFNSGRSEAFKWFSLPENAVLFKTGEGEEDYVRFDVSHLDTYETQAALKLNFESEVLKKNFRTLLNYKRSQMLDIVENGEIKLVSKLFDRITYWRKNNKQALKQRIATAVSEIISKIEQTLERTPVDERQQFTALRLLFLDKGPYDGPFAHLPLSIFYRQQIKEDTPLEAALDDQFLLSKARREFIEREGHFNGLENPTSEDVRERDRAQLSYMNAKQTFAHRLGIPLKQISSGGSGGARKYYDREGRPDVEELKWKNVISVVKPEDEGPHGIHNPRFFAKIKRLFVSTKPGLKGNSEGMAEQESYVFDRAFGLNLVPPTDFMHVESPQFYGPTLKECSVQLFVENAKPLSDYFPVPSSLTLSSRNNQRAFLTSHFERCPPTDLFTQLMRSDKFQFLLEKVAFHDFALENLDCHFENVLLVEVPLTKMREAPQEFQNLLKKSFGHVEIILNGVETFIALVKHDGGASSPHHHPDDYLSLRFKHLFEILPPFNKPFTKMRGLFNEHKLNIYDVLVEKVFRQLKKVDEHLKICSDEEAFIDFWTKYREDILNWAFSMDSEKKNLQKNLLKKCTGLKNHLLQKRWASSHLDRIHANIRARIESWLLIEDHFRRLDNGELLTMRDLLNIRSRTDFDRELKRINMSEKIADFVNQLPKEKPFYIEKLERNEGTQNNENEEIELVVE